MDFSCPAKGQQCRKRNHFASVCRSVKRSSRHKKNVQVIDGDDSDSSDENGFSYQTERLRICKYLCWSFKY
ncbi:hypothetical protein DPMN_084621 [Dreissena polymorpha]|uniref:Uncharacterized protein n=1 Tax=Dreissena polymorpha TaxID=45954 RepID=A0A9D4BJJ9_DREPO|nr:hypothetical protein DPMN_084621 [Dreissena polymorpha]